MEKKSRYALYIPLSEGKHGGAERRLLRIYNQLATKKDIDLIIRGMNEGQFYEIAKSNDINFVNFKSIEFFNVGYIEHVKCLLYLMKNKYTSIHFFDYSLSFVLLYMITRSKLVCTVANYECDQSLEGKKFSKLLPLCDYVDLLYPNKLEFIRKISKKANVFVTPGSFTDLNVFYPKQKKKIIAFSAARLRVSKNPMLLVKAAKICQEELRKNGYSIVILGQGFLEEEIKDFINKYNISDVVNMSGYTKTSDIVPYASVFTSLQIASNYPSQSLIEGIASGCYVIATNTGDTYKMVDGSFSTLISNDENELAKALVYYMNMNDTEKEICKRQARSFAEKNFSIEKSLNYFDNILDLCSGDR